MEIPPEIKKVIVHLNSIKNERSYDAHMLADCIEYIEQQPNPDYYLLASLRRLWLHKKHLVKNPPKSQPTSSNKKLYERISRLEYKLDCAYLTICILVGAAIGPIIHFII